MRRLAALFLLATTASAGSGIAAAQEDDSGLAVSARVEPAVVAPGDRVLFTVEVKSDGFGRLRPTPQFQLENLDAEGRPASRSESFEFVNGDSRRTLVLTWSLRPLRIGAARIHSIRIVIGDRTLELPDQSVTVDPNAPPTAPAARSPFARPGGGLGSPFDELFGDPFRRRAARPLTQPKVFLEAQVEPQSLVVGQQAVYTAWLYTQGDVSGVQPVSTPDFRGFWSRDLPQADNRRAEMLERDGERYGRVALLRKAIFPLAAGTVELPALEAEIALRVPVASPFGGIDAQIETLRRSTNPVRLEVAPLPPAPEGFTGAVGRLRAEGRLEPSDVTAGEAATLTVTVSGEGNLQGLEDPRIPALAGLRAFAPREESAEEIAGTVVRGRRTWRFVLVPEEAGVWNLPPVRVPFFDPQRGAYDTAATTPLILTAVARPAAAENAARRDAASPGDANGRREPGPAAESALGRGLPWALAGALGVALLLVLRRGRRTEPAPHGPTPAATGATSSPALAPAPALAPGATRDPAASSPRAGGDSRGGSRPALRAALAARLEEAARESRPRGVAVRLEEAWRSYLEAAWGLPGGTPLAQWTERLAARGWPGGAEDELHRLAEDLEYLRQAPQLSSSESLRDETLRRSRSLLALLR